MLTLDWRFDPSKQIVAPPIVRLEFQASPRWFAQNPGVMDVIGDEILRKNQGLILNWIAGQRQNADISKLLQYRSYFHLPQMVVEFTRAYGHDMVRIVALPENPGRKVPTTITLPILGNIEIDYKFHGWPIPASNYSGGGGTFWATRYFDDFASTPGWWTSTFAEQPILFPGNDLWSHIAEGGLWEGPSPDETTFSGGWPKDTWQSIQAGSTYVPNKLSKRQYWEVEVKQLATAVPDTVSFAIGNSNVVFTAESELLYTDGNISAFKYPPELNTWRTPTIGVLTGDAVPTTPTSPPFTPALIGGDQFYAHHARSIGATPIAYIDTTETQQSLNGGGYVVHRAFGDILPNDGNAIRAQPGGGNELTNWVLSDYIGVGSSVFHCNSSGTGLRKGPEDGSCVLFAGFGPGSETDAGGTATFTLIGFVGGPYYGDFSFPGATGEPGSSITYTADTWSTSGVSLQLIGDTFGRSDGTHTGGPIPAPIRHNVVTIPDNVPLNTHSKYMPVIKGRRDNFVTTNDRPFPQDYSPYRPDAEIDIDDEFEQTGFYTGIELGECKEGDLFMVATDTTPGAAYIWFGKNEQWYGPSGPLDKGTKLTPENAAAKLDRNPDKPDQTNDYYAAVSYRMGEFKATIRLAGGQKFAPPAGFEALAATSLTSFTIAGPDKDPIV